MAAFSQNMFPEQYRSILLRNGAKFQYSVDEGGSLGVMTENMEKNNGTVAEAAHSPHKISCCPLKPDGIQVGSIHLQISLLYSKKNGRNISSMCWHQGCYGVLVWA